MHIFSLAPIKDYELLDSGQGYKLERFGAYILSRPDPNAIWRQKLPKNTWLSADAFFHADAKAAASRWHHKKTMEPWQFTYGHITLQLKLSPFKHTGLFPEQIQNWEWFSKIIKKSPTPPKVLNLFGYTGGATLAAAEAGAEVTHVDASKPAIAWARENQKLSGMEEKPIRWIIDDALAFVEREARRGNTYDAVIMDPPSFGRDPKGKVFKFEKDVPLLLNALQKILDPHPLFVLINSYAMGYSPTVIKNILGDILPLERITCGELHITETSGGRSLPCSVFARYE